MTFDDLRRLALVLQGVVEGLAQAHDEGRLDLDVRPAPARATRALGSRRR